MKVFLLSLNTIFLIIIMIFLYFRLKSLNQYIYNASNHKKILEKNNRFKISLYVITIIFYVIMNIFILYIY